MHVRARQAMNGRLVTLSGKLRNFFRGIRYEDEIETTGDTGAFRQAIKVGNPGRAGIIHRRRHPGGWRAVGLYLYMDPYTGDE